MHKIADGLTMSGGGSLRGLEVPAFRSHELPTPDFMAAAAGVIIPPVTAIRRKRDLLTH